MNRLSPLLVLTLLTAACADFPRDPDNTLKRVERQGSFRVGLVEPLDEAGSGPDVDALLQRIGAASHASPKLVRGGAEPLLSKLEDGELELVIGRFEKKSPWAPLVTIGPPLRKQRQGKVEFHLAPVMRNGENAWIALVEREVRNLAPEAG